MYVSAASAHDLVMTLIMKVKYIRMVGSISRVSSIKSTGIKRKSVVKERVLVKAATA